MSTPKFPHNLAAKYIAIRIKDADIKDLIRFGGVVREGM